LGWINRVAVAERSLTRSKIIGTILGYDSNFSTPDYKKINKAGNKILQKP